jgi:hypothetical protein
MDHNRTAEEIIEKVVALVDELNATIKKKDALTEVLADELIDSLQEETGSQLLKMLEDINRALLNANAALSGFNKKVAAAMSSNSVSKTEYEEMQKVVADIRDEVDDLRMTVERTLEF